MSLFQHAIKETDNRYHCEVCKQSFKHRPDKTCPGATVYSWGAWPEHLLTKKQLDEAGYSTGKTTLPKPAGAVWREKSPGGIMWLYDKHAATPKRVLTPAQLETARQNAQKLAQGWVCRECGERQGYFVVGGGLCRFCSDKHDAAEWAREILTNCLILDTETSGLSSGYNEIIEIAVINHAGDVLLNTRVKPLRPERILEANSGRSAYDIHGIHPDALTDAPTFPQVYTRLRSLLADQRVVSYNAAYDTAMLAGDCEAHGLDALAMDDWECAMLQYAQYFGAWSDYWHSYRWQPLNGGHSALEDCQAVLELLKEMATGGERAMDTEGRG